VQLDFRIGSDPSQCVANAAGGGVVPFPKTGAEQQDFFHDLLGRLWRNFISCVSVVSQVGKLASQRKAFNGYLHPAK
jgi:hypothetical protein